MKSHPFVTGGPVSHISPVYIKRNAEDKILFHLTRMEYITLIEPRQQGKTSLIQYITHTLKNKCVLAYVNAVRLDKSDEKAWYSSLFRHLLRKIRFLSEKDHLLPPHNASTWSDFMVYLAEQAQTANCYVVIAIDELGDIFMDWRTGFFSNIRAIFDERESEPCFQHLTFILSGTYDPRTLMNDPRTSPFNVAQRVHLPDFTLAQTKQLVVQLGLSNKDSVSLAQRVHYWTDGHPYLTQRICRTIAEGEVPATIKGVDLAVDRLYQEDTNHLPRILEALEPAKYSHLRGYVERVLAGHCPLFRPASESRYHNPLSLIGVLKSDGQGYCKIRNRIYEQALQSNILVAQKNVLSQDSLPENREFIQSKRKGERKSRKNQEFKADQKQYRQEEVEHLIQILHLSDIHLENKRQALKYRSQLETDLIKELNVKRLKYLVISGDIANYSIEVEYQAAFEMLDGLVKRFDLDTDRVIIVPGNHDLNWDLSEKAYPFVWKRKLKEQLDKNSVIPDEKGAFVRDDELYQQRFANFNAYFYKKVYNREYSLDYAEQAMLVERPDDRILFLGLNSCWQIDHHFTGRAGINMDALSNALNQLQDEKYDSWLKIAIWHHPVTGSDMMKNVDFLEQLTVHGFQICMHGHIHEAQEGFYKYDSKRGLHIIGAGTFGAPASEQVPGIPLQYNLLIFNPEKNIITVETRKKEKPDGAWSADARWGDKKDPKPRYTISHTGLTGFS